MSVNAADTDTSSLDLAPKEMLAAYLVHEPYVEPMLRLLLDMSEQQRRMSLAMMQCIALGHGGGIRKAE